MAKLNYVEGDYKEALNIYARVGLDELPLTAVPPYRLRMVAEAYATKGEPALPQPRRLYPGATLPRQVPSKASRLSPLLAVHASGPATRCFLRASVCGAH